MFLTSLERVQYVVYNEQQREARDCSLAPPLRCTVLVSVRTGAATGTFGGATGGKGREKQRV